jgi:hypothetical protein
MIWLLLALIFVISYIEHQEYKDRTTYYKDVDWLDYKQKVRDDDF